MYYYNKKGDKIDQEEWLKLTADMDYKVVKRKKINNILISTVWYGVLDVVFHSIKNVTKPGNKFIFETAIFRADNNENVEVLETVKHETLNEAKQGYKDAIKYIKNEHKCSTTKKDKK